MLALLAPVLLSQTWPAVAATPVVFGLCILTAALGLFLMVWDIRSRKDKPE